MKAFVFFVWDASKNEHDEVLFHYFFYILFQHIYLNLVESLSLNNI